jgi:alpha-beta hydrolase superfamily lysophospholipase
MSTQNVTIQETTYTSSGDGITIYVYRWLPADLAQAKGVLHIVHGSIEHAMRYDRFAQFLVQNGYIVVASDYRGHGKTGAENDQFNIFSLQDNGWRMTVEDLHDLNQQIATDYPNKPLVMMGHSMGSFLVRHYMGVHGHTLAGAIIMGTGRAAQWLTQTAQVIAKLLRMVGDKKRLTPFMHKLVYGQLNDAMDNPKTDYDFLSRDSAEVQKYIDDPWCGNTITVDYAHEFATGLMVINDPYFIKQTRTDIPLLFTSGKADPVGGEDANFVHEVAQMYRDGGNEHITVTIYDEARHEILNETNRDQVMADILAWMDSTIGA